MGQFRHCVNDLELKEVPLLGRRYTWSNARATPTLVRFDRWFASLEWEELFPDASLTAQSSSVSDHCPVLLSMVSDTHLGRRFRFERFWLRLDGFAEVVQSLWDDGLDGEEPPTEPIARLAFKLKQTSRGLQRWSQRKVGSIRDSILIANEVILQLETAEEGRQLSDPKVALRRQLKHRVLGLASLERTIARQHARVAGLKGGDASF
jgi:hypothetical protein